MEGNGLILSLIQASLGRRRPRPKNIESYRPRISQKHPKRVFIGDPCPRRLRVEAPRPFPRRPGLILVFLQQNLLARIKLHVRHRGIIYTV